MLDVPVIAWVWMLFAMLVSSGAGLALSRLVTWTAPARQAGIPRAFGLAIAPFLLGLMAVVALGVFRGASHAFHLGVVFAGLLALCAAAYFTRPVGRPVSRETSQPMGVWEWTFGRILAVWAVLLIIDALFMPLMQNDALEYALVGRLLFEQRDLLAYPALDPVAGTSGFYGPWTHPPLYPALIYITNVFQGHADAPGLMRLISPWCALAATGVVYSMGCLANRLTGLLSALIFLSTPLLFLGAGSAFIDPLPILGMTLVLCTVPLVEGSPVRQGVAQGSILGIALWTHSQAVLLVPLAVVGIVIHAGWRGKRTLIQKIPVLLGVSGLVAAWPYCRNLALFGSLISDNPAVFALPALDWPAYFSMARGLVSWPEKIQYGLLKGWFAPEAYSLSFWFMTIGAALFFRERICGKSKASQNHGKDSGTFGRLMLAVTVIVIAYLGGTALSMLMRIDLMIRNERYLLMLMPCVALLSAGGIVQSLRRTTTSHEKRSGCLHRMAPHAGKLILTLLTCVLLAQLLTVGAYRWKAFGASAAEAGFCREAMMQEMPAYRAVDYLRQQAPPEAIVLSLKPADMYYSDRRMLSYLDPRMIPFYEESDAEIAWRQLRDLGVTYLHVPDYSLPPIYNSALQAIMGRRDLSRLVHSSGGYQIYELQRTRGTPSGTAIDIRPGAIPWSRADEIVLGGRKNLFRLSLSRQPIRPDDGTHADPALPFFLRERATMLLSGLGHPRESNVNSGDIVVSGEREYLVDLLLEGDAFAQVYVMQYDAAGRLLERGLIGEIAVGRQSPIGQFFRRFVTHPEAASVRFGVGYRGNMSLSIVRAALASTSN